MKAGSAKNLYVLLKPSLGPHNRPGNRCPNLTSSVPLPNDNAVQVLNSAVITPNGRYLYQNDVYYLQSAVYPNEVQIAGFFMDSVTGALSPVSGSPASLSSPSTISGIPILMAIDPAGKFLYAGYQFAVLDVGPDGGGGRLLNRSDLR